MADPIYSAADIVDKTLFMEVDAPYYDSVPSKSNVPKILGYAKAGTPAGQVYSWIDSDPYNNRPQLWWMFYPGSTGKYYYMPHSKDVFDLDALEQQGVLSDEQKAALAAADNQTWYEKLLNQALPWIAVIIIGGAAVRGYMSRKNGGL